MIPPSLVGLCGLIVCNFMPGNNLRGLMSVTIPASPAAEAPTAAAVDPAELKPGLIAEYREREAGGQAGRRLHRLEPTVALLLGAGESVHPQLKDLGTARWWGHVNLTRAGAYRFSADLQGGSITVRLGGQVVLQGRADAQQVRIDGPEIVLDGGVFHLEIIFRGERDEQRCTLWWQGPGFIREPLNSRYVGHLPTERPPQWREELQQEHGRYLFEELSCIRCHRPGSSPEPTPQQAQSQQAQLAAMAATLADRPAPKLAELGRRVYPGWLDAWLADPARLRPHTTMPQLFAADERGRAERYAIIQYFVAQAGQTLQPPAKPLLPPNEWRQSVARGRVLFQVAGCAACHQRSAAGQAPDATPPPDEAAEREPLRPEDSLYGLGTPQGPTAEYALGAIGSKTRPEILAEFLRDPLRTHPAGRMPQMNLTPTAATDLARYLCENVDREIAPQMPPVPAMPPEEILRGHQLGPPAEWQQWPVGRRWAFVGEKLLVRKGCVHCHEIEAGATPPPPAAPSLAAIVAHPGQGCLDERPSGPNTPRYALRPAQRQALQAFVQHGLQGAGRAAPTYQTRVALRRLLCLNCHSRDGEGGIPPALAETMRLLEKAENADDVRPPVLTGIGHKARSSWLTAVLTQGARARPWMQLRMPQYGTPQVGTLVAGLPRLDGLPPDDAVRSVAVTAEKVAAGRQLVGKGGLGCVSCHDISGVANPGTRGPDLATIQQRVRYEWYERWLHQPLRMVPGTRMPQAFVDGQSTLRTVLNGDPVAQAEAMWAYLSLGPGLPLPEGLEPPRGLVVAVRQRPELLRTFMPEAGTRAIAVGYPGGVHLAFDADQCRIVYAWSGNFLDASPVWNNRGGAPAKLLGPKFWTAPPVHPWGATTEPTAPPDFLARRNDPAWGFPLPVDPPRVYDGPLHVHFEGYTLTATGAPVFRYRLALPDHSESVVIQEQPGPLRAAVATGLTRQFTVTSPREVTLWFFAAQATARPRLVNKTHGRLDPWPDGQTTVPAEGTRVVGTQDGGTVTVWEVGQLPAGAAWYWQPAGSGGPLLLRIPVRASAGPLQWSLTMWVVPRDDAELIRNVDR